MEDFRDLAILNVGGGAKRVKKIKIITQTIDEAVSLSHITCPEDNHGCLIKQMLVHCNQGIFQKRKSIYKDLLTKFKYGKG